MGKSIALAGDFTTVHKIGIVSGSFDTLNVFLPQKLGHVQ